MTRTRIAAADAGAARHTGEPCTEREFAADMAVHLIGVTGALVAVPVMIALASFWESRAGVPTAIVIYGISLVAMLSLSAGYNWLSMRAAGALRTEVFRRLDHAAIFAKIAGTYTPYAVIAGGPVGRWMLIGIWSAALLGMLGKMLAPDRWPATWIGVYLGLGWVFVLAAEPVSAVIAWQTMVLIVVGGGLYSVGVIFHLWSALPYQNAIWHLFVLVATGVFYAAMMVEIASGG